ncbi:MAG: sulfurtransferase-like selenium metabolism protein YedF [Desulfosarcinaceae bacterium]|jgi:selenium metabolism protein YedF
MKEIDARGLACPAPVLQTKAALQEEGVARIKVVVDNAPSQQNVQRFLESQGFTTTLAQSGEDYLVVGSGDPQAAPQTPPVDAPPADAHQKIMVMCATDRLGYGDDDLGRKLMVNYIRTLAEMGPELWRLVFVNNGVKLTTDGSEVLADLQAYAQKGLKILVCGTCLDHFDLVAEKRVGETTNMLDIVTATQLADKVINL